jgi:hypothetical protein
MLWLDYLAWINNTEFQPETESRDIPPAPHPNAVFAQAMKISRACGATVKRLNSAPAPAMRSYPLHPSSQTSLHNHHLLTKSRASKRVRGVLFASRIPASLVRRQYQDRSAAVSAVRADETSFLRAPVIGG